MIVSEHRPGKDHDGGGHEHGLHAVRHKLTDVIETLSHDEGAYDADGGEAGGELGIAELQLQTAVDHIDKDDQERNAG